ncbi:MAG: pyridoxine 5'-phosphate synthase [Bacteroidetes bacterium]|jgi:pyridoxine 5-phosphate synthase|nr:pyridoxine 5'-phosphate synthase [Bacteroidota bacterium]
MARLSVNINKIATLRNARGGHQPDLIQFAKDCEKFGAQGITVHPRPDERHIRYNDVELLKPVIVTEFNIEGNPTTEFIDLVLANKPDQVTLVPDDPGQLTSNHGWDTNNNKGFLIDVIGRFREAGIRTSIFVDPVMNIVAGAAKTGADRIELYTESYALGYIENKSEAVKPFIETAVLAKELGLGLNAGHDLSLINLNYFVEKIPWLKEVSIGHALICDSLNYGLENTIQLYLRELKIS